jgi:predicted ATPase
MATRFTRLALSNWRNFRKVDLRLGQRVFIVGPNASGKSNLIDALRFLRDIAAPGGSLLNAVKERQGMTHIRSLHAIGSKANVRIEVELLIDEDPQPWAYTLELSGSEAERRPRPLRVELERVRHGEQEVLSRPGPGEEDPRLLTQTHLEQISQSLKFSKLAEALASLVSVHVVPQVARIPARAEEFSKREAPGSDFIDQLASLPDRQQGKVLRQIERLLRVAVPRFSELAVDRDELGRPHLKARYEHWRRQGSWQNEQDFSDGTLRLIGLLWAIDRGAAPLLLEEPELSLHRDVIRQLPRLFARAAQETGRQVIISTHAEEMLADPGIDPSEIVLLEPSEAETKAVLGSDRPDLVNAARAGVPLGRLVTSMTRPRNIEQLSLDFSSERQR